MIINAKNLSLSDYWKRVREIQRDLRADAVVLASVPELAAGDRGVVQFVEADSLTAAKCLFAGTHRIATPEECAQREAKRVSDIRDNVARHLAQQGVVQITLPQSSSE